MNGMFSEHMHECAQYGFIIFPRCAPAIWEFSQSMKIDATCKKKKNQLLTGF